MDLLTELARLQAENAALRDRVEKLEECHRIAGDLLDRAVYGGNGPTAEEIDNYEAACKLAGVKP